MISLKSHFEPLKDSGFAGRPPDSEGALLDQPLLPSASSPEDSSEMSSLLGEAHSLIQTSSKQPHLLEGAILPATA